jgi:hypothetical protein
MKQRDHLEDLGVDGGEVYTGIWRELCSEEGTWKT